ncbi:hypothetical protein CFOL_v3_27931 [Cephalotus follicularis]|uniref:Uncharacterized protein n=1 Tax=Cephalotus follicularis TaxID=3775 RepID=A0A1Q3CW89_CEPFO|nr:hypothetical protein CFOL_v3_27931 [Cephalotus follicularis]
MDGAEIGVLEEPHKVCLGSFLEGGDGATLEPEIGLEVLSDLPHQPLEGELPYQQLSALLVLPYLPQGNSSGPESMWLLHSSGGWGRFPRRLCGKLLSRCLAAGGLPCCLLCASHFVRLLICVCFSRKGDKENRLPGDMG